MNIALVTSNSGLEENVRIREEFERTGHTFKLIDLKDFEYKIKDNRFSLLNGDLKGVDIIVLRGIFASIKRITSYINILRGQGVKVFDNNFLADKYSIDKPSDLIKLTFAGIPVPDTAHVNNFSRYVSTAEEMGYPIVVKFTRAGKGDGIYKLDNKEALANFMAKTQEEGGLAKDFLIQDFIPYEYDLRILIIGNRTFCMRRIPQESEFRANFSLGGSVEKFALDEADERLARRAMEAVGLEVAGVDMLMTKDGKKYILEVNHTPGMIGMEKATGENITKVYVDFVIENAN